MAVSVPTPSQLREVASEVGLDLTDADVTSFIELMRPSVAAYNVVDAMPDNLPPVRYPRTPGYRPTSEENAHNAWYVKTKVDGAPSGKLRGKTVALKDNIMLAGVPMMNGSATLEGYMPNIDPDRRSADTDAGGTNVGKAHCEAFSLTRGSHTNAVGPVHNPHRKVYSAAGSSSGQRALVALVRPTWLWAAIRAARSGSRRSFARCVTYGRRTGWCPTLDHADRDLCRPYRPDDLNCCRQRGDAAGGSPGPDV